MVLKRQLEILKLLHTGKPSKVIASQLGLSVDTVKSHLSTLYAALDVHSRSEAIAGTKD